MSEFKKVHTLLNSHPLLWLNPFLSLSKAPFSLCLMLAILVKPLPSKLMSALLLYPNFALKSILCFLGLLEVILLSFPLPTSAMPSTLLPLVELKMLSKWPNLYPTSSMNLSLPIQLVFIWKDLVWKLWSSPNTLFSLLFAYSYKDWTVENWKKVIWSDETKINHLGSDRCKWALKRPGEGLYDRLVDGTLKFGGSSLMIWGCITWEGVGFAFKINGRMDGDLYL